MHVLEWRAVAGADTGFRRLAKRVGTEAAHGVDVLARVQSRDLVVRRHARLYEVVGAERADQIDRRRKAARRQRMLGAEVVFKRGVAVDDERAGQDRTVTWRGAR